MSARRSISRFIIWLFASIVAGASIYKAASTLRLKEIAGLSEINGLVISLPFTLISLFVILLMKGNLYTSILEYRETKRLFWARPFIHIQWVESCGNPACTMDRNWRMAQDYICFPAPAETCIIYNCFTVVFFLPAFRQVCFNGGMEEGSKVFLGMGRQYVGYKLYMPVLPDIINVRSGSEVAEGVLDVNWFSKIRTKSISVFAIQAGGCMDCAHQFLLALSGNNEIKGISVTGNPKHADCLLICGCINGKSRTGSWKYTEKCPTRKPL